MGEKATVAVVQCDATASDEQVKQALFRAADMVADWKAKLGNKRKIIVKPNMGISDIRYHAGRQVALADRAVVAATIALIRQFHSGEIIVGDASTGEDAYELYHKLGYDEALKPYDVTPLDMKEGPYVEIAVPGGGIMFTHYWMNHHFADADAIVSIAKMKSHLSTGATGTLKNLFGMTPTLHYGNPRRYLHAPVRLPRSLVDIGLMFPPVLNVIDGLVGQDGKEWHGRPMQPNCLIVGDNCVATDAVQMMLMGFDPTADYGTFPFYFDSNTLELANSAGLGTNRREEIRLLGDDIGKIKQSFTVDRDTWYETDKVRRAVAQEALFYRDNRDDLLQDYIDQIVALSAGEVLMATDDIEKFGSRGEMSRRAKGAGILLKKVVPAQREQEHLRVYEEIAA